MAQALKRKEREEKLLLPCLSSSPALLVPKLFLHSAGVFTGLPNVCWLQSCSLDRPTGPGSLAFVGCFLHWEHLRALLSCLTGQPSCTPAPRLGDTSHTLPLAGLACLGKSVQAGGDMVVPAPVLAPCSSAPRLAGR